MSDASCCVVGTVIANKKFMPKEALNANLKKAEMIARESKTCSWNGVYKGKFCWDKSTNTQKPLSLFGYKKVKQGEIVLIKWDPM